VILDTDWDSLVWAATDRRRAARIATAWNEHLPDPYLPRSLAPRLRAAGFEIKEIRIVPRLNTAYDATTFSHNIAPLIAAFVPGRAGVSEDDASEWLNDLAELQHQGRYFFSINRYLFAASRPQSSGPRALIDWSLTIRLPRLPERSGTTPERGAGRYVEGTSGIRRGWVELRPRH
jgi:hypothetical protein